MGDFLLAFTDHWGWLWLLVGAIVAVFARVAFAVVVEID